jgi:hypothetical protein
MLIECDNCNAIVETQMIASYIKEEEIDWCSNLKFSLCKCSQCWSPILVQQGYDYNHEINDFDWEKPIKIYPSNLFHINPVIPEQLRKNLIECIKCYKVGAFTATAIMCRKTLDGFCSLKGVKEKNLGLAIKKLKEQNIINDQLYEWANELRLLGNKAAHSIDHTIESVDGKDILEFTIAILDFTYSFKDKFDKFKSRLEKK